MPANFPTAEQKRYYGRFVEELTPEQLGRYFHLSDTDRHLVYSRAKEHTQLGLAVQLGTGRFLGLFLTDSQWHIVPHHAVRYVAAQLSLAPALWQTYFDGRRPTISDHQTLIRQQYGYRDFSDPVVKFAVVRWLYTRAWLHDEPPSRFFDLLVLRLKERKVLLPGITALEECINHIRDQAAQRIWTRIDRQLTNAQRERMQLLVTRSQKGQTPLDELRHGAVTISPGALKTALERIKELRKIAVSDLDLSWLSPDRLKKLARHAGLSKAYTIRRLSEPRK